MKSYINQKSNFYKDEKVIEFINWFVPKIDSGFTHQYINQRNKKNGNAIPFTMPMKTTLGISE